MKIDTNPKKINKFLERAVEKIVKKEDLLKKLSSGKKLRVKHGVDPTTKDLHLGYSVVYLKLKELQEMGHKIVFLIGDFTARFGDPTEKSEARKLRPAKEVRALAKNYLNQVGKILDLKKTEVRYNSEWYGKMKADELLMLMSNFTTARMLERGMFQDRIKKGLEIGLHEPVYPVLQSYDSAMLKSDLTICGTDQLFNELKARDLQEKFNQEPQEVISTKLLVGLDGHQKMSQSLGNYIGIEDAPKDKFGRIMSIPDELIGDYFELCTRSVSLEASRLIKEYYKRSIKGNINKFKVVEEELGIKINEPKDLKIKLAKEIVRMYHGEKEAEKQAQEFDELHKNKQDPKDIRVEIRDKIGLGDNVEVKVRRDIKNILVRTGLASSKSDAKRLIEQGGVKINGKVEKDWNKEIKEGEETKIQVGKRKFVKLI